VGSNTIDAPLLAKMFLSGAKSLEAKKEWINELNVFPVPDGDTGTNMTMTIMTAAREVVALEDQKDMEALCKAISGGSLRGARGNSGVILSQLLRGFTRTAQGHTSLQASLIADAMEKAVETAYKAVMKPKEGTILTVAKGCAERAREMVDDGVTDLEKLFSEVLSHGKYVLSQTPEMLPVLKQAGVVDSGGQGLIEVLNGAMAAFLGKEIAPDTWAAPISSGGIKGREAFLSAQSEAEIEFGYCTEFIILLKMEPGNPRVFNAKNEIDFKAYLESVGDSIVCVADDELVKVHVHTNDPGMVIQKALKYGPLSSIKIDNMRLEHQEKLFKEGAAKGAAKGESARFPTVASDTAVLNTGSAQDSDAETKPVGFIAISAGDGMNEIFKSLGVDYLIEGGQTMNPSTADILDAVELVHAETVFILPNNKNIILAANQAAELSTDKTVLVIPTKTIPQGITAVINYVPELSDDENESNMIREIGSVKTGQVTYAVRDTQIDQIEIHQGDYMGLGDNGILSAGQDKEKVVLELVEAMVDEDTELVSIYYGSDIAEDEATKIQELIAQAHPGCDVELQMGGQPIYYYIISAE
jgi:DAK2 domain fusion protein YloV